MNFRRFCFALLFVSVTACAGAEAEGTAPDAVASVPDQDSPASPTRQLYVGGKPVAPGEASAAPVDMDPRDVVFETTEVVIETADGQRYPFVVEMAETPEQRRRGLMFRDSLAADSGMLFLFDQPRIAAFWMKNTFVSLDMLFLTQDGRIADYYERAQPGKWMEDGYLAIIKSKVPVSAVLEVPAGTVDRLDLALGDRVRHPVFEVE